MKANDLYSLFIMILMSALLYGCGPDGTDIAFNSASEESNQETTTTTTTASVVGVIQDAASLSPLDLSVGSTVLNVKILSAVQDDISLQNQIEILDNDRVIDSKSVDAQGNVVHSAALSQGLLNFRIKDIEAVPLIEHPISMMVIADADGYISSSTPLTISTENSEFSLNMVQVGVGSMPAGVATAQSKGAIQDGKLQEDMDIVAGSVDEVGGYTRINVPAGTEIKSEDGTPLEGELTMEATYFNSADTESMAAFPGGLQDVVVEDSDSSGNASSNFLATSGASTEESSGFFVTGGFTAIEMTDEAGTKAKTFSEPITASIKVPAGTINPETNQEIQLGDNFPIWSYEPETGKWKREGSGVADGPETIIDADGDEQNYFTVSFQASHLSYYNMDWHRNNCAVYRGRRRDDPVHIKVEGNESNSPLTYKIKSASGRGLYFSLRADGTNYREVNIRNAPKNYPVILTAYSGRKNVTGDIVSKGRKKGEKGLYIENLCSLVGTGNHFTLTVVGVPVKTTLTVNVVQGGQPYKVKSISYSPGYSNQVRKKSSHSYNKVLVGQEYEVRVTLQDNRILKKQTGLLQKEENIITFEVVPPTTLTLQLSNSPNQARRDIYLQRGSGTKNIVGTITGSGTKRIEMLTPGDEYTVFVKDKAGMFSEIITLVSGENALTIPVPQYASVTVAALSSGATVGTGNVDIKADGSGRQQAGHIDATGSFEINDLMVGKRYTIYVDFPSADYQAYQTIVVAASNSTITFELPFSSINVVASENGTPISYPVYIQQGNKSPIHAGVTHVDTGMLSIDALRVDKPYTAYLVLPYDVLSKSVESLPQDGAMLTFDDFQVTSMDIMVHLFDQADQEAIISVKRQGGVWWQQKLGEWVQGGTSAARDGALRISGLLVGGSYDIQIVKPGYNVPIQTIGPLVTGINSTRFPANSVPVASHGTLLLTAGTVTTGVLQATDADGDTLTYILVSDAALGSVTMTDGNAGSFTYSPNDNAVGQDAFTFKVNDGFADSNVAMMTVTIQPKDSDGDGVFDTVDNCLTVANRDQADLDDDQQGNACDNDDDGDGVLDNVDAFPLDDSETLDTDGDGIGNNADTDDDGDGVSDSIDPFPLNRDESVDTDGDEIGNNADLDDDNDGIADVYEIENGLDPLNPADAQQDADGDGLTNLEEYRRGLNIYRNETPTISDIGDQFTDEDTATGAITFSVSDIETPATQLAVLATSMTPSLVVDADIEPGGSGANRTITMTPKENQFGLANIQVAVSDGISTATDIFTLTIRPINDPPIIADVFPQNTDEDTTTVPINVVIGDVETAASDLRLTAISSDATILPNTNANIVLAGDGVVRTLTATPAQDQNGPTTITMTVSDGELEAVDSFVLTVGPVNDLPLLTLEAEQTTDEDIPITFEVTVGDLETPVDELRVDVSVTSHTALLVPDSNIKVGKGLGAKWAVTVTPLPDVFGEAVLMVTVRDDVSFAEKQVNLTIRPINDAPTISNLTGHTIREDTFLTGLSSIVHDVDNAVETLVLTATSSNTQLVPNDQVVLAGTGAERSITITPSSNKNGETTIMLTVSDGSLFSSDSFVLTVDPVNDPPQAVDAPLSVNEDQVASGSLQGKDDDQDLLVYSIVEQGTLGRVDITDETTGGFTYTPNANVHGADSFTFKVYDGSEYSNIATITVTIKEANDVPTALNGTLTMKEDTEASGTLGVIHPDDHATTFTIVQNGSLGTATLTNVNTGTYRYIPNANAHGSDSFTFKTSDVFKASNPATISVTIQSINDAPVTSVGSLNTNEDAMANSRLLATDIDGDTLAFSVVTQGTKGSISLIDSAVGTYTYTPNSNATGDDSFSFKVHDGSVDSNTSEISVTINSINDAPIIATITHIEIEEDSSSDVIAVTVGDVETSASDLILTASSSNHDLIAVSGIDLDGADTQRTLQLTPISNRSGKTTITLSVNDGAATTTALIEVTVPAKNDPPVASSGALSVQEDTLASGILIASDLDSLTLTYSIVRQGGKGAVAITDATTGAYTYTPNTNIYGADTFTFKANDGENDSNIAKITVTISAVNDAPTFPDLDDQMYGEGSTSASAVTFDEDTSSDVIGFTIDDVDTLAADLTVTAISGNSELIAASGIALAGSDAQRTIQLTPVSNRFGTTSITLSVSDGEKTTTASIQVAVKPVNDLPVASSDALSVQEDTLASGILIASDLDSLTLTYSIVRQGGKGAVAITDATTGAYTYTPNTNIYGADTFTFKANDGENDSNIAKITVTISAVNDAPTFPDLDDQMYGEGSTSASAVTFDEDTSSDVIGFTIDDVDTLAVDLTVTAISGNSELIAASGIALAGADAQRTIQLTPVVNRFGTTSITLSVSDGEETTTASIQVTVKAVNDLPVASVGTLLVQEDTPASGMLIANDPVEKTALTYSIVSQGGKGTVSVTNATTGAYTYTPHANIYGTDFFTFKANDGEDDSIPAKVTVTILPVDDAPILPDLDAQITGDGTTSGAINITIADVDSAAGSLTISVSSSNTSLIPNENIVISGEGFDRTIRMTPVAQHVGTSVITITISDGHNETSKSFTMTVYPTVRVASAAQTQFDDGIAAIVIQLSTGFNQDVTIPYSLSGSAAIGSDYAVFAGVSPVVISAGALEATVSIALFTNTASEQDETIILTLGSPSGAMLGTLITHTLTIDSADPGSSGGQDEGPVGDSGADEGPSAGSGQDEGPSAGSGDDTGPVGVGGQDAGPSEQDDTGP